jgi:hypothetical protein
MPLIAVLLSALVLVANIVPSFGLEARHLRGSDRAEAINAVFPARIWDKNKVLLSSNGAGR